MKYEIHNLKTIANEEDRARIIEIVDKLNSRIKHVAGNYPKPLLANIYFNKGERFNYVVSCMIKMKEGVVFVKEKGKNPEALLHKIFDKLKVLLNKKINKERREYLNKSKNKHKLIFDEYLPELQELKRTDTRETFNQLLKILLSDVAKYVNRRIKSAEMTTAIKKGKFKKQEILDDIYLHVYDNLKEIPGDEAFTRIWLYRIADGIMDRQFKEIEFEKQNFERLTELVDKEYAGMEEAYTIDAEEEIIPMDELDEYENQSDLSMATTLFEEDENSILDTITLNINKRDITRILDQELAKLSLTERTIMEFYLINQMSVYEIAEIKRIPESEVEKLTARIGEDLRQKLTAILSQK